MQLGLAQPFRWVAGRTGVKNRRLAVPVQPGMIRLSDWLGPECLAETFSVEGRYDPLDQCAPNALLSFFEKIYEKCGTKRPAL